MSAFLCNPTHIGALTRFAAYAHRVYRGSIGRPEEIARELATENWNSIEHKYGNPGEWGHGSDLGSYISSCLFEANRPHEITPVQALKMISCLQYQSCEHPGYHESEGYRLLERLRDLAIDSLPGYDEAPWEYNGPKSLEVV